MAKMDLYFTFHMWADNDQILNIHDKDTLQEALEGMIEDLAGDCEDINYRAELTDQIENITVNTEAIID